MDEKRKPPSRPAVSIALALLVITGGVAFLWNFKDVSWLTLDFWIDFENMGKIAVPCGMIYWIFKQIRGRLTEDQTFLLIIGNTLVLAILAIKFCFERVNIFKPYERQD